MISFVHTGMCIIIEKELKKFFFWGKPHTLCGKRAWPDVKLNVH